MKKEMYVSPAVEHFQLSELLNLMDSFSGSGNIGQYEEGDDLEVDFDNHKPTTGDVAYW